MQTGVREDGVVAASVVVGTFLADHAVVGQPVDHAGDPGGCETGRGNECGHTHAPVGASLKRSSTANVAVRAAGYTGEIILETAEAGGMMQMAADQDELVASAKAHRLLGWRPRHASFTDNPEQH